jgi:hypothetical protein
MVAATERATFHPADPDGVVAAAFACPYCLRVATDVEIGEPGEAAALACCERCVAFWPVLLTSAQRRRLVHLAPEALRVRVYPDGPGGVA